MQSQFEPTTIENPYRTGGNAAAAAAATAAHEWLLRTLGGLKSWVAWSIGACTAWIGAMVYLGTEPGAPSAPFIFFCLGITALYYLLLLLATRLGAVVQRTRDEQKGHMDRSTALYNRTGLIAHGDELLAACRQGRRSLSMVVFDCSDLLEVRALYGSRISRDLLDRIVGKLVVLAGDKGLAARTGPAHFTVVMPVGRERALQTIQRVLGSPIRIELDAGDNEIVLVPDYIVECAAPEMASVAALHDSLCRDLARVKQDEQRRQHYLQRERERHSRPMSLPSAPNTRASRVPDGVPLPMIAPTVPSSLMAR